MKTILRLTDFAEMINIEQSLNYSTRHE